MAMEKNMDGEKDGGGGVVTAWPVTYCKYTIFKDCNPRHTPESALKHKDSINQDFPATNTGIEPWEQGIRHPEGPARILLQVIEKEPEAVLRALR